MQDCSYLVASTALVAVAATAMIGMRVSRRGALLSGALAVPTAAASPLFVPDYWRPTRVAQLLCGPEDVLFSFAAGALAWSLATTLGGRPRLLPTPLYRLARRTLLWGALAVGCLLLLHGPGLGVMHAVVLSLGASTTMVLLMRPRLWRLAVAGALGYGVLYTLFASLTLVIWPSFLDQWNHAKLSGLRLLGTPVEEGLYAVTFGAAWPVLIAWLFEPDDRPRTADANEGQAPCGLPS